MNNSRSTHGPCTKKACKGSTRCQEHNGDGLEHGYCTCHEPQYSYRGIWCSYCFENDHGDDERRYQQGK